MHEPRSEPCQTCADAYDSSAGECKSVGRSAATAGVAADGGHRRVFAVLTGGLDHPTLPSSIHAEESTRSFCDPDRPRGTVDDVDPLLCG